MFKIDRQELRQGRLMKKIDEIRVLPGFRHPEGKAYAICLKDAFELISSVMYLREHGASILLFHSETPHQTVRQMALAAGCHYVQYGSSDNVSELQTDGFTGTPGLLQFSSGTTGQPKLILRSWSEIDDEVRAYNHVLRTEESSLILAPVSHSFGLITGLFAALERGASAVVADNKNPKFLLELVSSTQQSFVYAGPFVYQILLTLGKEKLRFHKLVSSGAPLSDNLLTQLRKRSVQVWQQYGCTEAGSVALGSQPVSQWDTGEPLPHLNVSIRPVDSSNIGEIVVETSTGKLIHTGDLGMITEEKRLQLYGRMDDLINVGGFMVNPREVESVIERMPGIRETVVFKTRHLVSGEAVKALIVADESVSPADVKSWCMETLPPFKIPGNMEKVTEIPRLPSGKISRKVLEEQERMKYGQ